MNNQSPKVERRKNKRIKKHFLLSYYLKENPEDKHEMTQLKNISLGGLCFITTRPYAPGTVIGIDLNTPYLSDTTYLEGVVLESHETAKGILYNTRLKFKDLTPEAEFLLKKIMDFFANRRDEL